MSRRALITGITGQDGAYLARLLLGKGYRVFGAKRHGSTPSTWRLDTLGVSRDVELVPVELLEYGNILRLIERVRPDEVYNLAAISYVAPTFDQPLYTAEINGLGVVRLLEALRQVNPGARFYQASTSEMFGRVVETPQNERTPFRPRSPYACAKLYAHVMTVNYREAHGMHACCGILFNHESPLRGAEFVTRKIVMGLAAMLRGELDVLRLGNMDARRDWGYADDYVLGMWQMLQQDKPGDYVLATGETNTIRDFLFAAAEAIELPLERDGSSILNSRTGKRIAETDPTLYRPAEVELLCGDATRARSGFGWNTQHDMRSLAGIMMAAEMGRA